MDAQYFCSVKPNPLFQNNKVLLKKGMAEILNPSLSFSFPLLKVMQWFLYAVAELLKASMHSQVDTIYVEGPFSSPRKMVPLVQEWKEFKAPIYIGLPLPSVLLLLLTIFSLNPFLGIISCLVLIFSSLKGKETQ